MHKADFHRALKQHDYDSLRPIYQATLASIEDSKVFRDILVDKLKIEAYSFFNNYPRKANRIKESNAVNKRTVLLYSRADTYSKNKLLANQDLINCYKVRLDICLSTAIEKNKPVKKMHVLNIDGQYFSREFENRRLGIESHHLKFLKNHIDIVNKYNSLASRDYEFMSNIRKLINASMK
jgi:hypothetical protein